MLKKISGILLAFACSTHLFAGSMGSACVPGAVNVPCPADHFDFGVQALYLKPTYNSSQLFSFTPVTANVFNLQPDWDWGYRLTAAYYFGAGHDVNINWSHFDASNPVSGLTGAYVQLPVGLVAAPYQASLSNRYDQVNLVMGQVMDVFPFKGSRFYGGLQYAEIQVDATKGYAISPLFAGVTGGGVRDLQRTDFNGFGPVAGIDYAYGVLPGLSLTANTAASLLYGTSRLNDSTIYNNGLVAASAYGSHRTVVPGFEAKLGANYAYVMAYGILHLEGGYQVVDYLKSVQSRSVIGLLSESDFGLYGPYLGLRWSSTV